MCKEEPPVLNADQIADLLDCAVENADGIQITAVMGAEIAGESHAAFFTSDKLAELPSCSAGLVIVDAETDVQGRACVRVKNPSLAAAILQQHFFPRRSAKPGIHGSALIHEEAFVHASAEVGPWCEVRSGATVGANSILSSGVVVGEDSEVGENCHLYERVTLYREVQLGSDCVVHAGTTIGVDGFGFVWSGEAHEPMPQTGTVEIGSGCVIGANCAIDRATFGVTQIGRGCIIDNLVQVGHNCQLGDFVILCGQAGLAGSSILEDGAVMGGQAGAGGHITIGAGAQVGGGAKVFSDIAPGSKVAGDPAIDYMKHMRAAARRRRGE
ncbi:MAG TPA: UDP-3-O-(3-hydroxymyristoyl)glucosamine N-acyltransferase [Planctomycetota bacterium]|jgi:UDP-3-O-[3-hydroxymyristoyl] glucosamine N-acyltransferase|nr:UDP-3-O-(3-hydroxymyristoyl)glucosamine N-acyltransferase [Planctomycetota bacterium]MDP7246783.1 UDP-3-O-(3-hydroxymyristoyl)glucosamine N-acyltransferase [Planctomycetota bacterium]HJM38877.1 UDP-3-O-(3-hydroxymyristoyl)glucosamine N-acyltransferase [Planctomycetota bacterium]|tara:strand:+ start:28881 stop:29861 length:981 start_codon:yes stop_codon:yes gene_type:complete